MSQTARRGVSAADNGQLRADEQFWLPGHEQRQRRVADLPQEGRKVVVVAGDQMVVRAAQPVQRPVQGRGVGLMQGFDMLRRQSAGSQLLGGQPGPVRQRIQPALEAGQSLGSELGSENQRQPGADSGCRRH